MNNELKKMLKAGKVCVIFTKVNGSERTMNCTLSESIVPQVPNTETKHKKQNEEVCPVWDVDLNAWRSFRFDSVKSYKEI